MLLAWATFVGNESEGDRTVSYQGWRIGFRVITWFQGGASIQSPVSANILDESRLRTLSGDFSLVF